MSSNQSVYRVWTIDPNNSANNKFMLVLSSTLPTEGPNGELINPNLTVLVQSASEMEEVIVHEPTNGLFQAKTIPMDVPAGDPNDETDIDVKWPADIMIWQSSFTPSADMVGDSICVIHDPDKNMGHLTHDAIVGDDVIHVNPDALTNLQKGLDVSISNGVKKEDLGAITDIDYVNNTLTVENMVQSNFYVSSGTVELLYNYCMIKDRYIENTNPIIFGSKGFRGKELPSGMEMRVKYTNANGQAKKLYWHTEYYIQ